MKRTSLTTAVIAGIAGVAGISNMASAVYLNNDGLGQVLIYPYYTVNNGYDTLLTVVNTTAIGKAVKVRFLEGYDSREVLDFNLYLSPHDVWTAAIVGVPSTGGAGVWTNDNSCTVPTVPTGGASSAYPFQTSAFDGGVLPTDGGPTTADRTLEGYVELIEMGTVTNATQSTLKAITHKNGVPANCQQVYDAWNGGYWATSAGVDIAAPTGGLFGSGALINVAEGTIAGYNADAIDQFYLSTDAPGAHHTEPGSLLPSIADATFKTSYVFAPGPTTTTPTLIVTPYAFGVDAVSSLFTADAIYNEYWTNGGTAASSEWVVTFPTKRFYVDPFYVGAIPLQPFEEVFNGESAVKIGISVYDREEKSPAGSVNFSPVPKRGNSLVYEAQVVTFNQSGVKPGGSPSAILGSHLATNIPTGSNNGWAQIDLYGKAPAIHNLPALYTVGTTNQFNGLPVTGFWIAQLVNGNVGGVLSNYSGLFRHKLHRTIVTSAAPVG